MGNTSTFVPSSRDVARGVEPTLLSIPRSLHVLRKESPRLGRPRYLGAKVSKIGGGVTRKG